MMERKSESYREVRPQRLNRKRFANDLNSCGICSYKFEI